MTDVPCTHCGAPAVAVYRFDRGCAARPQDTEQALCPQHIVKANPMGDMQFVRLLAEPMTDDAMAFVQLRRR